MKRRTWTKIMSIFAVVMSLVFPIGLVGCSDDVESATPYAIKNFVNFVTRIETPITIDSGADIEAGYIIFEHLNDSYKTDKDVQISKSALDDYKSKYDVLKAEQDRIDAEALQASHRSKFEKAVGRLPGEDDLTLKDRTAITAAYALYENLDDASRAMSSVAVAYSRLRLADQIVEELEYNALLEKIKAQAAAFAENVESLVEEEISLKSADAIDDLQYAYKNLPDEAKKYENVIAAKAKLDAAASEYQVLKDEADVEDFLSRIEKLPAEESITLDNKSAIVGAEKLYGDMSDAAKAAKGVAEALEKLVAAREKYDVLFAAAEEIKIQEFIAAANAVPTDIGNVDITWFGVLDDASEKYWALSIDSQGLPEVEEAFNRWNAAQKAFDKKGYKRVPMTNPYVVMSGDNPPHLELQRQDDMFNPLCNFFGVNSYTELDANAVLELNVYVDGEYVGTADVEFSLLTNNGILYNTHVVNALKALSAKYDKIVSGANYSFSFSVRDKNGEFIRSKETSMSDKKSTAYIW